MLKMTARASLRVGLTTTSARAASRVACCPDPTSSISAMVVEDSWPLSTSSDCLREDEVVGVCLTSLLPSPSTSASAYLPPCAKLALSPPSGCPPTATTVPKLLKCASSSSWVCRSRSAHFPDGVSWQVSNIPIAVATMRTKGTRKATRQATCGVRPRAWTRESKRRGITK